jgi:5'-nucleotidase (lipoprotein e(P4) family)
MRALYLQSYHLAKVSLAYQVKHKKHPKKKNAIVVDIDETILNNSPYQAWLYLHNQVFSDSGWNAWVQEAKAEPLPGTVDFLNYAKGLGCEIFYISNRKKDPLFAATLSNLKKFDLPYSDSTHLLLKTPSDTTASGKTTKEKRRRKIEQELNCEILLLCGDQLADFDKAFDVQKGGTDKQILDSITLYRAQFGHRFIVLPNPMYGDWLAALVNGSNKDFQCSHLDSLRKKAVLDWKKR